MCSVMMSHSWVSLARVGPEADATAQLGWQTPCLPRTPGLSGDKVRNALQRKQAFLLHPKYETVGDKEGSAS